MYGLAAAGTAVVAVVVPVPEIAEELPFFWLPTSVPVLDVFAVLVGMAFDVLQDGQTGEQIGWQLISQKLRLLMTTQPAGTEGGEQGRAADGAGAALVGQSAAAAADATAAVAAAAAAVPAVTIPPAGAAAMAPADAYAVVTAVLSPWGDVHLSTAGVDTR